MGSSDTPDVDLGRTTPRQPLVVSPAWEAVAESDMLAETSRCRLVGLPRHLNGHLMSGQKMR